MNAFLAADLPHVNEHNVTMALATFGLPLQPDKNHAWLAMAVSRALAITIPDSPSRRPDRASNAETRKELERMTEKLRTTWATLFGCSYGVDARLWSFAFQQWEGNKLTAMEDPAFGYNRFRSLLPELDWLASYVALAAPNTQSQPPNWRLKSERDLRVERGQYLAPVFEAAFGQPVSVNNWPNAQHKAPTPFMDFYQRMMALSFSELAIPNLSGVLKDATGLHRHQPIVFAEDIIPGL